MLELFMDPLGALVITFFVMGIISAAASVLVFLAKNEKLKKGLFFFLTAWSIIITHCNILGTPDYMITDILIALVIGALGVGGLLVYLLSKKENKFEIARIMVVVSVVVGMIDCFMI